MRGNFSLQDVLNSHVLLECLMDHMDALDCVPDEEVFRWNIPFFPNLFA